VREITAARGFRQARQNLVLHALGEVAFSALPLRLRNGSTAMEMPGAWPLSERRIPNRLRSPRQRGSRRGEQGHAEGAVAPDAAGVALPRLDLALEAGGVSS